MFGGLSSKGSGGTLDAHQEEDHNEDSEPGSLTAERNKDLETSVKVGSTVKYSKGRVWEEKCSWV